MAVDMSMAKGESLGNANPQPLLVNSCPLIENMQLSDRNSSIEGPSSTTAATILFLRAVAYSCGEPRGTSLDFGMLSSSIK